MVDIAPCPICGGIITHLDEPHSGTCEKCGKEFTSYYSCENDHQFCDLCYAWSIFNKILHAFKNTSKNPFVIADEIMDSPEFGTKGCIHYVVPSLSVILAFRNVVKASIVPENFIDIFEDTVAKVPVSFCKINGNCGIPFSCGETLSAIMPLIQKNYNDKAIGNKLSTECMIAVANNNKEFGQCCKRNTYISILVTAAFFDKYLWVELNIPKKVVCKYSKENPECIKDRCKFYRGFNTTVGD